MIQMVEIIDIDTGTKMIAMIFGSVKYDKEKYVIYCVRREKDDANVFVSKLVQNSQGYAIDHEFRNGEKEVIEGIIQRILSKVSKDSLEKDDIQLFSDFDLIGVNYFDIKKCYVSTVSIDFIKECMIHYGLVSERVLDRPVIEVKDEKKKFNEGFVSSLLLILLGISLIGFSLFILYDVFMKK